MARQHPGQAPGANAGGVVVSVDAMGGDNGPDVVVAGLAHSAKKNPDIRFILHGPEDELRQLVAKRGHLAERCDIRDAESVVTMDARPSQVVRQSAGSSMQAAIESVRDGEATVCVSCGNTGALMALAMIQLKKLPGVARPAIAVLLPARTGSEHMVMLDVGADVRAEARDLLQFALMGASYARNGLGIETPQLGLLNVGTEHHKGRSELRDADEMIAAAAAESGFSYAGFVEGSDIMSDRADVIVTDGFTGNVAIKTAEGTAGLIRASLSEAFRYTPLSRIAALLAYPSLRRLAKRIDPRRRNGGVFLGLNGTVVKSHGSADATGVSAAVKLACRLAATGFSERLAARVASTAPTEDQRAHDGTGG